MKLLRQKRRLYDRVGVKDTSLSFHKNDWISMFRSPNHSGPVMDLGKGGLSFVSDQEIEEGSKIQFELQTPDRTEPIQGTARIVWREEQEENESYCYGIEFLDLPQTDLSHVEEIVQNSLLQDRKVDSVANQLLEQK